MSDLEANMMHFQLMHESLARFSESFASFMYGLNMNAFCVDYPEVRTILPIYLDLIRAFLLSYACSSLLTDQTGTYSRVVPQGKATRGTRNDTYT